MPPFYKQFLPAGAENDPFVSSNGAKSADEAIRNKLGQYSLVEVKALEDYSRDSKHGSSGILEFLSRDEIASPETKRFIADFAKQDLVIYFVGVVLLPILSVTSTGTRHPLSHRASKLNHEMTRMIFLVLTIPK